MVDDATLLQRWAQEGDEAAFSNLVQRHLNLVWGVARRITGDPDRARDVAQTVFADLARKAPGLPSGVLIEGWLHRAASLAATKVLRGDSRRTQRERQAMELSSSHAAGEAEPPPTAALQSLLDEALGRLDELDRQAVILRFLTGRSFAAVGRALGLSEDAAQKRVSRALGRLRDQFRRKGIVTSEGVLGVALGLAGSHVAPAGLAATVAAGALAGAGTLGWLQTLLMMKTKIAFAGAALALMVVPVTWQHLELRELQAENRALRSQAAQATASQAAAEQLARLQPELEDLARLRAEHLELLRLRAEVGRLRQRPPLANSESPKPPVEPGVALMPTRLLLAPMKARVKDGETLVTGGWTTAEGRRGLVMVTPQIGVGEGDGGAQVTVNFTLLEGAESAFVDAGLGDIRGDQGGTTAQKYSAAEATALLRRLAATGSVDLLEAPRVSTLDGRQAQITSGGAGGMATSFDVIPRIDAASDGAAVEMTLVVTQTPSEPSGSAPVVMPLPAFADPPAQSEGGGFLVPAAPALGEGQ